MKITLQAMKTKLAEQQVVIDHLVDVIKTLIVKSPEGNSDWTEWRNAREAVNLANSHSRQSDKPRRFL